ncbi:unnamed protein product [Ilex paraguariensis]|uniref:ELMO domain-containing protein n=1 Tax=Ilex paraguariensis TaxID=185542 RepID=A0ABC8SKC8_9AQUA
MSFHFTQNHFTHNCLVAVASAMVGPRAWIGGIFSRSSNKRFGSGKFFDFPLSPLQEQGLRRLQARLQVPFDETRLDHQEALRTLWKAAFPTVKLKGLISEQWKDMGWQGPNPSTDFRGCGFVSLENLLFFARIYPASFHRLLFKQGGKRATWEYPFAVAGINVSFMLIQMLDLYSAKPRCLPGINFVKLLGEDEEAFDVLYCIAFEMMDAQWLAMHASYMEFNSLVDLSGVSPMLCLLPKKGGFTSNKDTIGEGTVFRRYSPNTRSASLQPVVSVILLISLSRQPTEILPVKFGEGCVLCGLSLPNGIEAGLHELHFPLIKPAVDKSNN